MNDEPRGPASGPPVDRREPASGSLSGPPEDHPGAPQLPDLASRCEHHLQVLAGDLGARPPGSPANRQAATYAAAVLADAGLVVREHAFATRWWEPGPATLTLGATASSVAPDPYSPATEVQGPAVLVADLEALEALEHATGRVLVVAGPLAAQQVLPEAFPFLDLDDHARIRAALRRLAPAAVVAVSDHWEPFLEDPDLGIASVTVPTALGGTISDRLPITLRTGGAVHAGTGTTVTGWTDRAAAGQPRLVVCAHLDSKATTPGAFDNAGGVAAILAAAEVGLLGGRAVEVVLFNGEDHADACGEVAWLEGTDLAGVVGAVNLDGIGLRGRGSSLATLACPGPLEDRLHRWARVRAGWVVAEPWWESDHALFAMRDIPSVAITSEDVHALLGGLAHTAEDTVEVVDVDRLASVAADLPEILGLLRG